MPPKQRKSFPELDPELKEMYEMPETEFKTMLLGKINAMQQNRQVKEMRN